MIGKKEKFVLNEIENWKDLTLTSWSYHC